MAVLQVPFALSRRLFRGSVASCRVLCSGNEFASSAALDSTWNREQLLSIRVGIESSCSRFELESRAVALDTNPSALDTRSNREHYSRFQLESRASDLDTSWNREQRSPFELASRSVALAFGSCRERLLPRRFPDSSVCLGRAVSEGCRSLPPNLREAWQEAALDPENTGGDLRSGVYRQRRVATRHPGPRPPVGQALLLGGLDRRVPHGQGRLQHDAPVDFVGGAPIPPSCTVSALCLPLCFCFRDRTTPMNFEGVLCLPTSGRLSSMFITCCPNCVSLSVIFLVLLALRAGMAIYVSVFRKDVSAGRRAVGPRGTKGLGLKRSSTTARSSSWAERRPRALSCRAFGRRSRTLWSAGRSASTSSPRPRCFYN